MVSKARKQRTVVGGILDLHQLSGIPVDGRKLLLYRHAGNILLLVSRMHHILQRSHPHHKEFVKIGGGDAHKFQPFQQGYGLISCFIQHSGIEFQPAQLPVFIINRIFIIYRLLHRSVLLEYFVTIRHAPASVWLNCYTRYASPAARVL